MITMTHLMQMLLALAVIIVMTLISKAIRQLATGRSDSIALEVALCSFTYNLIYSVAVTESPGDFVHHELMRCIVLLLFAFIIAAVHKHYKDLCMAQIDKQVDQLDTLYRMNQDTEENEEDVTLRGLRVTVLRNVGILAREAISVCYSTFIDRTVFNSSRLSGVLRKRDKKDTKGFRRNKSVVRQSFSDLLNNLGILGAKSIDRDRDLNIDEKSQITGLIIFDVLAILALLTAIRLF